MVRNFCISIATYQLDPTRTYVAIAYVCEKLYFVAMLEASYCT